MQKLTTPEIIGLVLVVLVIVIYPVIGGILCGN
jgi:hypothetical protein